jgi:flagellar protein FliS
MTYSNALKSYQENNLESAVNEANPHKLVELLLRGAAEKIMLAKQYMEQKNIENKGINISHAISIIDGLQASINKERGGELAENLFNLYDYMTRRLVEANLKNDALILEEVLNLLGTIKSGWDEISNAK